MKNYVRLALCIAASASLLACNKHEENLKNPNTEESIALNDLGMLKFSNNQSFRSALANFDKISPEQLEAKIKNVSKEFVSYRADTLDDNKNPWDFDPTLSRILDKNGAVQVGDSVYFFSQKVDYKIAIKDQDLINKAVSSKDFNSEKISKQAVRYTKFSDKNQNVKRAGTSTQNYNGSYQLYTPEVHNGGRPERAVITLEERQGSAGLRFNAVIYGQAYRRGGLFGSKKWRDDEIHNVTYDMIRAKNSARTEFEGPFYNLQRMEQYETKFYSTEGPMVHNSAIVEYLDVDMKTIKKNGGSAVYSVRILIDKYSNGQRYLTLNTSW